MFARSTTIWGSPDAIDAGIAHVRDEVMPVILEIDGCAGLSMLVDRGSGQCIATSSWESREAMRASNTQLTPIRDRVAMILGGTPTAEEWEVAVMHRDHHALENACCRVTWLRTNTSDVDRGIELYRTTMLPEMETLPGFCSASLFVDRDAARAVSTTTYDSRETLEASRDRAWAMRDRGIREAGVDVTDVGEFDLVLAHLRVPEMA